jgi:hypothetical protein
MTISRHSASPSAPVPVAGPLAPPAPVTALRERTDDPAAPPTAGGPAGAQAAPIRPEADARAARRTERLAEMVAELTGCEPAGALEAVKANNGRDDPLETVARAMIAVEHDDDDRFRITGYLRPRPQGRRAARRAADVPRIVAPRPHPSVVAPAPEAEVAMSTSQDGGPDDGFGDGLDAWLDDVVMDLRAAEPDVRIDLTMLDRMARVRREHRRH